MSLFVFFFLGAAYRHSHYLLILSNSSYCIPVSPSLYLAPSSSFPPYSRSNLPQTPPQHSQTPSILHRPLQFHSGKPPLALRSLPPLPLLPINHAKSRLSLSFPSGNTFKPLGHNNWCLVHPGQRRTLTIEAFFRPSSARVAISFGGKEDIGKF